MSDDQIQITRHELMARTVDEALAKQRQGRERIIGTPLGRDASWLRRLLHNPMFYLPLAALLGALLVWRWLEPKIDDTPLVRGPVVLVNSDPFDAGRGTTTLTIGDTAVYVDIDRVDLVPGRDGQPPFASFDEIHQGTNVEVVGIGEGTQIMAVAIRPTDDEPYRSRSRVWPLILLFPLTAAAITLGLLISEGISSRNWLRMIERSLLGSLLASVFSLLAFIPAGICFFIGQRVLSSYALHADKAFITVVDLPTSTFVIFAACRAAGWACIGAALGVGMNLVRSTRMQLRNSVVGGALGGAFGGLFFDPVDRFFSHSVFDGSANSRMVGLAAVALSVGFFLALVERLGRDAWLRVRTGPLAGKSFVLYKTPTTLGSAPQSDIYLYKDAEIDGAHAAIHKVGATYEIEDLGSRMGTQVSGGAVRRRRLTSGDQIVLGGTILDFEERQKRVH